MFNEIYKHTKYFVEECGKRTAGTEAVKKASDYIVDYYKKNGIKTEIHEFNVPVCEIEKSQLKFKTTEGWIETEHTAALFSRATPDGGITLPLVYAENGSIANLKDADVKGKAVLICRDVYMEYPDINMYKRLHEFGAAAVIYTTNDGHWDVPYVYANFETMDEEYTIPTAVIHYRTALKLLNNDVSEVFMDIKFNVEMKRSVNTIGVIEGRSKADENIVVCAHLDSAHGSTGATDDVAGVATFMELAKYYQQQAKAGNPPEKTIRFIAWSGHECGLHGSKYYLLDNPEIRNSVKFVFNYDVVGNTLCNYSAIGAAAPEVEAKLNEITEELELDWPMVMAPMVVDALNFAAMDIPHITLTSGSYGGNHTVNDSMKLISPSAFRNPVKFSKAIIEWASGNTEIKQGYPQELTEALKTTAEMYGWGLFGKID